MESVHVFLSDVCLFLDLKFILTELVFVCKDWKYLLSNENFISYWIRYTKNVPIQLSNEKIKELVVNTNRNRVLNFAPWRTDGGSSHVEINSSYKNLWTYNCTPYSTYYSTDEDLPLKANVNCLAVFEGGYLDTSSFFDSYNADFYSFVAGNPPEQYKIEHFDEEKCLTLDPLHPGRYRNRTEVIPNFEVRGLTHDANIGPNPIFLQTKPAKTFALVTKIAIARPFNFTGPVKTLILLAKPQFEDCDFQDFHSFDNIFNFEAACSIGKVKKTKIDEEFEAVEYQKSNGCYPLLWLKFKSCGVNHIEYELSEAHLVSIVNCKLLEIDDRRVEWGLERFQANFDVTYVLLIGSECDR